MRRRRTDLGWSLERLGEEARPHWTDVGSVERGERNVSLRNILKLAGALDVDAGRLPDRRLRLHIHPQAGHGDGLCGSPYRAKEPITVTPGEIIYRRRIAVLEHAGRALEIERP